MRTPPRPLAATAIAVCLFVAADARAGEPPKRDLDAALAAARNLVDEEKWDAGKSALRKVFVDFDKDPRVVARLPEIEEDLRTCLFRRTTRPPDGKQLLGDGVKSFNSATRDVQLKYDRPWGDRWNFGPPGVRVLEIRFDVSITVECRGPLANFGKRALTILLCYDLEKRGGYIVTPGLRFTEPSAKGETRYSLPGSIVRRDGGEDTPIGESMGPWDDTGSSATVTVSRQTDVFTVKVAGKTTAKATDARYMSGYLAVANGDESSIEIKGRLERTAYRKLVGEYYAAKFKAWSATGWDRTKEIPDWARSAPRAGARAAMPLPGDAQAEHREDLADVVSALEQGDVAAAVVYSASEDSMPPLTGAWLKGLAKLALGRTAEAESQFDKVLSAEPSFAPAQLYRALARFRLRKVVDAKADLERAAAACASNPRVFLAMAHMALFEHDVDAADAALARAATAGLTSTEFDVLRTWVLRAKRGPNWTQRFEHRTEHFTVTSDHSKKVCYDVATLLEQMQAKFAAAFGTAKSASAPVRVWIFSGLQGYTDWAGDLLAPSDQTAGMYLPTPRQIAIWIPVNQNDFLDTARHEGFHQYVARFTDELPTWLDEGWAQNFETQPSEISSALRERFLPVDDVLRMDHAEFMQCAEILYPESREIVRVLLSTKDEALRGALKKYCDAILAGTPADEAYPRIFSAVVDRLDSLVRGK